ncbi:restriction endonuclease [Rhizobium ruizarguesonis]|uniref:restriction endonuclease n=1 Tax=Rhizobium ruizarguesonis TaxID=2081791 RepID=UPI001FDF115D|nr:restriction endonuclease [Rhizobium ruizarguesonis]
MRRYLLGRFEQRFELNDKVFEQVVESVFKDLGYITRATGRSGDKGIDVILYAPDGKEIGVQVKRYKNTIQVDQIRELAGSLVLNGITRGIFVTTSGFTAGGPPTAGLYGLKGYPIELIDAQGFLAKLEIAQQRKGDLTDSLEAPWRGAGLRHIHNRIGDSSAGGSNILA